VAPIRGEAYYFGGHNHTLLPLDTGRFLVLVEYFSEDLKTSPGIQEERAGGRRYLLGRELFEGGRNFRASWPRVARGASVDVLSEIAQDGYLDP